MTMRRGNDRTAVALTEYLSLATGTIQTDRFPKGSPVVEADPRPRQGQPGARPDGCNKGMT